MNLFVMFAVTIVGGGLWATAAQAAPDCPRGNRAKVTIGYQLIYNPWKVLIHDCRPSTASTDCEFERETCTNIEWEPFDSGAKVAEALARGDVQIALAGSSAIARALSDGIDIQLFWIAEDIASAEAMLAQRDSGIESVEDLRHKKLAVPFFSTSHFHALFALEHFGVNPNEVQLINLQPQQIVDAWKRGDIDAAYVWHPALGYIQQSGKPIVASDELSAIGPATFDGMVVMREFAEANPEFMASFVKTIAAADTTYRDDTDAWTPDSQQVQAIVSLVGGNPDEVPGVLALYGFPTMEEQASARWLGGGAEGGAARALSETAEFLQEQGAINNLLPDYGAVVTPAYVEAAMKM